MNYKSIVVLASMATFSFGVDILDIPRGAESVALGNSGVAFSNEPNSVILNPANLALYAARSGLSIWGNLSSSSPYTKSLPDATLEMATLGGYLEKGDLGCALSANINSLNYPTGVAYNPDGSVNSTKQEMSDLSLGATAAVHWKNIVGVGMTIKPFKVYENSDNGGNTIAFDLGVRGQYRKDFSKKFYTFPGAGISLRNFGNDSIPQNSSYRAIPQGSRTLAAGLSFECGMPDAFWIMLEQDISSLRVKDINGIEKDPTYNGGIQFGLTPLFQFNLGYSNFDNVLSNLSSEDKDRTTEFHWGITTGYRNIQFMKFLNQMSSSKDFTTNRRNFEILYSLGVVNHKSELLGDYKTYTHQVAAGFEFWKRH